MAVFYITEYTAMAQLPGSAAQMPDEGSRLAEQVVSIGAAAQSVALNSGTKFVRCSADAICSVLFGFGTVGTPPNPQAAVTTSSQRFAANQTEFKGVPTNGNGSGNNLIQVKIAVIANT